MKENLIKKYLEVPPALTSFIELDDNRNYKDDSILCHKSRGSRHCVFETPRTQYQGTGQGQKRNHRLVWVPSYTDWVLLL